MKLFLGSFAVVIFLLATLEPSYAYSLTVEDIKARGNIVCGIENDSWGNVQIIDNTNASGVVYDLALLIAEKLGVEMKYVLAPWGEGEPGSISGTWTCGDWSSFDIVTSAVSITKERSEKVTFSEWYFTVGQMLIIAKNSGIIVDEDAAGRRVGYQLNTTSETIAKTHFGSSTLIPFDKWSQCRDALIAGGVDAAVIDSPIALQLVRDEKSIIAANRLYTRESYGIVMPKDVDPELKKIIDEVVINNRKELYNKWYQ